MTKRHQLFMGLIILCLALPGSSWGQSGPLEGKGGGPGSLYNPKSVVTVAGIVVSMTPPPVKTELPHLVYLTLKTGEGKITIFLGPSLYVDNLPVKIKILDRIQVTGSKIMWEGFPVILAAEVKRGGEVLKLREPNGVPVWSSHGHN